LSASAPGKEGTTLRKKSTYTFEPLPSVGKPKNAPLFAIILGLAVIVATVGGLMIYSYSQAQRVGKSIEVPLPEEIPIPEPETPVEIQRPSCEPEGTYLLCMCSVRRIADITCTLAGKKQASFYNAETAGGISEGLISDADSLSCTWQRVETFEEFVPNQNLCGDAVAQNDVCKSAAKSRPACQISGAERYTIDKKLDACLHQGVLRCTGQVFQSKKHDLFVDGSLTGST